ncbi:MAG: lipoate--protein ligase [candidate division KSB1 bacterium]|nr:lipoate--protein ligase [candidate division KSB1 bacterium]
MAIRLVDLGTVSYLRSQTVYHGVAYARTDHTPDTILLMNPKEPYVCVGFHQEVDKEVDMTFCREKGLPVLRREVGGGAVLLDENQMFTQWIMAPDRLPWNLNKRFQIYARPLVQTYHAFGIQAEFRPINDIHVSGRKIGGTGAAAIGQAEVMVGSFLFDFNTELMARVLKVPSEKFRDKVFQSLQEYMTTMKKELQTVPDREDVKAVYMRECEKALGEEIVEGELTPDELATIETLDEKFQSESWLYQKSGLMRDGVKIHQDVWVMEAMLKARGGLVRAMARLHHDRIEDLSLSGDFTFHPHRLFTDLEKALVNVRLEPDAIRERVGQFYEDHDVQTPGVEIEDWVSVLMSLQQKAE